MIGPAGYRSCLARAQPRSAPSDEDLLTGDVLRRDAGAGAQPVVEGVRELSLGYLDRAGVAVAAPGAVRSVAVVLVVGPVVAARAHAGGPTTTLSTRIRLRNR